MPYYRCPGCGLTSYSAAAYSTANVCAVCSATLAGVAKLHVAPGERHDVRCAFLAQPDAVGEARHALVGLALPAATRETLALVVSELVTNSVLHAGLTADDAIDLQVHNGDAHVRVAVQDGGLGFNPPTADPDPLVAGGQGLAIVGALSERWGVDCEADGCTVWCEVALDEEPPTAPIGREIATGCVQELAVGMAKAAAGQAPGPQAGALAP
jgi:anti-sigma regulatory factor (Ser/Thr protein kinase)